MTNSIYQEIIDPQNFIKNFNSKAEFENWLWLGSTKDLEGTLSAFEQSEMYEICEIIKGVISKK